MTTTIQVSKSSARRFLIQKQLLNQSKKNTGFHQVLDELECVQLDPVAIIERNHHLVFMNRLPNYIPEQLEECLKNQQAFEYMANAACLIPMMDYPIFKTRRQYFQEKWQKERHLYKETIQFIYNQLANQGPLPSKAFKSSTKVVGGWDHPERASTKETTHVLGMLFYTGEIQVCGRKGAERYFARTEDSIPASILQETSEITFEEANERLLQKYLRAYRLIDGTDPRFCWQNIKAAVRRHILQTMVENGSLLSVQIEGVKRPYFILAEDQEELLTLDKEAETQSHSGKVAFLPPLDNFLWRRERIEDLFDFIYRWEIYTPADKRRFGPYTMPILVGDNIVGRGDPMLNRAEKIFHMAIHYETSESKTLRESISHAAETLGKRLGAVSTKITEI